MLRQVVQLLGLSGSANPDGGRAEEAGFAIGIAEMRNTRVLNSKIKSARGIRRPRMLGELRKEYYKNPGGGAGR